MGSWAGLRGRRGLLGWSEGLSGALAGLRVWASPRGSMMLLTRSGVCEGMAWSGYLLGPWCGVWAC